MEPSKYKASVPVYSEYNAPALAKSSGQAKTNISKIIFYLLSKL